MRPTTLLLCLLTVLAGCSLSNAFLGFPDFFTNESACRDVQRANSEGSCRCDGFCEATPPEELERLCPSRLNERDGRCGDFFRCEQDNAEGLVCGEGVPNFRDCSAEFAALVCTDPFDDLQVTVTFTVEFEDADDCADAGVGFLFVDFGNEPVACETGVPLQAKIVKSRLPVELSVRGVDNLGPEQEGRYFNIRVPIAFEDLDENDAVDIGVIVMLRETS